MNEITFLLIGIIWLLTLLIAFVTGGALGTSTKDEMINQMKCSNCGHKGR